MSSSKLASPKTRTSNFVQHSCNIPRFVIHIILRDAKPFVVFSSPKLLHFLKLQWDIFTRLGTFCEITRRFGYMFWKNLLEAHEMNFIEQNHEHPIWYILNLSKCTVCPKYIKKNLRSPSKIAMSEKWCMNCFLCFLIHIIGYYNQINQKIH